MTDDDIVELLVILARRNIPPDVQELLVYGSRSISVAPGALKAALEAAGWRKVPEGCVVLSNLEPGWKWHTLPDGHVVVPKEPTDAMIAKALAATSAHLGLQGSQLQVNRQKTAIRYRAMLAAANDKPAAMTEGEQDG